MTAKRVLVPLSILQFRISPHRLLITIRRFDLVTVAKSGREFIKKKKINSNCETFRCVRALANEAARRCRFEWKAPEPLPDKTSTLESAMSVRKWMRLPSCHISTFSVSPGYTGLVKRTFTALKRVGSLLAYCAMTARTETPNVQRPWRIGLLQAIG